MHDYTKADLERPLRALCDLAVQITARPASVGHEEIDRLRRLGWSDAAISDAIQVVSYFNYVNRVADAVGIEDESDWAVR